MRIDWLPLVASVRVTEETASFYLQTAYCEKPHRNQRAGKEMF